MSHLYVANYTYQQHDFQYRVPEHEKVFSTVVPAGRQVRLPIDFSDAQRAFVIAQLERAGARPASDVRGLSTPQCLLFADREITSSVIDAAREKDETIRQEIANRQIETAGVAVMHPDSPDNMRTSELSVRELAPIDREEPVKGGVDIKVTSDRKAARGGRNRKRA